MMWEVPYYDTMYDVGGIRYGSMGIWKNTIHFDSDA